MRLLAVLLIFMTATAAQAAPICVCLKCAFGKHRNFWVAAAAMKPTLPVGACFVVKLVGSEEAMPPIGEIVVYRHPVTDEDHVFRLVATEGQTVALVDGVLEVNGQVADQKRLDDLVEPFEQQGPLGGFPICSNNPGFGQECRAASFRETLPNGRAYDIRDIRESNADNFGPLTVPPGHFFVLGDNRDNSLDSRISQSAGGPGFIPRENLIGIVVDIRN